MNITVIKSMEQAQNIVCKKLAVDIEDLHILITDLGFRLQDMTFEFWNNLSNWCESQKSPVSYRLFRVYIRTSDLRDN